MTTTRYLRAAFVAYEPDGYPDHRRVLPFRINPEALQRQLAVQQGQSSGAAGTPAAAGDAANEQSSDASSGAVQHSFSVTVRLDLADRHQSASNLDPELGVAPEIAAFEELMHPSETEAQQASEGSEAVQPRARRPTVLFIWGRKRVWPVRITGMTINELLYNTELYPTRAELQLTLEVLGAEDAAGNTAVAAALDFTDRHRRSLAQMFTDATADQTTNHPDL